MTYPKIVDRVPKQAEVTAHQEQQFVFNDLLTPHHNCILIEILYHQMADA